MSYAIMIEESNGNNLLNVNNALVASTSNDDLSQSLSISEYTDAEESMSAPTEFLAEFLSAVMLKDYRKALKYCKLILEFEPNNVTAKEFYPLIQEKMKYLSEKTSSDSDENYNNTSSPDLGEVEDVGEAEELTEGSDNSSNEADSDFSSSSDSEEKDLDHSNSNASSNNSTTSGSENTTHSYSSSLLEEEDDDLHPLATVENGLNALNTPSLSDLNNGNYKVNSCSDSESPTEPLTQQIAAILRSKITNQNDC